jgi:hemerythrin-like domain-containing protein
MAKETILNLMVNHHIFIEGLFSYFRNDVISKSSTAGASFLEFDSEFKKHLTSEEDVIFNLPQMKEIGLSGTIKKLHDEHDIMLKIVDSFSARLSSLNADDIQRFSDVFEPHRELEEKELYPILDQQLPIEQKLKVIVNISK